LELPVEAKEVYDRYGAKKSLSVNSQDEHPLDYAASTSHFLLLEEKKITPAFQCAPRMGEPGRSSANIPQN